jgi:hypothetical protein
MKSRTSGSGSTSIPKSGIQLTPDKSLAGAKYNGDPCAPLPETDWPDDLR